MMSKAEPVSSSFRDPAGFLFSRGGILYRQVNPSYSEDYGRLMESGLYDRLVKAGLLIPHAETDQPPADDAPGAPASGRAGIKVIQPERVAFISYPYEWSFGQLKDAALATLSIQKRALKAGMSLKDASAYNIQFVRGRPTLIDTLSFEIYQEGKPWVAYRQFCQHFLAPLALMRHADVRLNQLLRSSIDGVPLDLASRLLPLQTRLELGLLTHIHLHARAQSRFADADTSKAVSTRGFGMNALLGLIDSLDGTVRKLEWKPGGTEWGDYYESTNYSDRAFAHKKELVAAWVAQTKPGSVWDLGANTGVFSRVAAQSGAFAVAFDIDPAAVEQNYRAVKAEKIQNVLPLLLDLTNPSPALGWAHTERDSLAARGPADLILALAVIHHLAISNNVPLPAIADFFAGIGRRLVVEFVPKSDSQVQRLLRSRVDIFGTYTPEGFESAFSRRFQVREKVALSDSERFLYLMEPR